MSDPKIASRTPFGVDVEKGKDYFWCACGSSATQPFCDGSHRGTEFRPMKFTAEATGKIFFCGCKHTKGAPRCDGSHKSL